MQQNRHGHGSAPFPMVGGYELPGADSCEGEERLPFFLQRDEQGGIFKKSGSSWWLLVVLLAGSFLRLLYLGKQAFYLDEAWSWKAAHLPLIELLALMKSDPHPILYYLLLKPLVPFFSSEGTLRLFSAFCSILALALLMALLARRWSVRAALYGGWFMAWSSFDIYYAQELRMYTLLALLWLASYLLLLEGIEGRPPLLLAWAGVGALMLWTHSYGLLALLVQIVFLVGWWGWQRRHGKAPPDSGRWILGSLALALVTLLPFLGLFWQYRTGGAGGAWVPEPADLLHLFLLSGSGIAGARRYFLDGQHLVWAPLSMLPESLWLVLAFLTTGLWASYGLLRGLRVGGRQATAALLAIMMIFLPVVGIFGYASLFGLQIWAFKSFLGNAYLFYMWAGIGLAALPSSGLRGLVLSAVCAVALVTLVPYYTVWQKSDAASALQSLPPSSASHVVLLDPFYLSPLADYYLAPSTRVLGIYQQPTGEMALYEMPQRLTLLPRPATCSQLRLEDVEEIWIYGSAPAIRERWERWPPCLTRNKELWLFEGGQWRPLRQEEVSGAVQQGGQPVLARRQAGRLMGRGRRRHS